jgi:hypothetical protein
VRQPPPEGATAATSVTRTCARTKAGLDPPEARVAHLATSATADAEPADRASDRPARRAFRDCRRQLQDARATTDAGLADQLVNWSRALLLYALNGHVGAVAPSLEHGYTLTERPVR